jgi:leucyl-tRNA synthetase
MSSTKKQYTPKDIEAKLAKKWVEEKTFATSLDTSKPKMHVLDMFPYPSGEGLHTGHCKIFTASDVYARFKRMQGYNVLHATGWDAFGLPAEQYALKHKVHPKETTKKNTDTFRRQMQMMGFAYDWDREINTTDPSFYKWTQWIFLQLWNKGLVKEVYEPINWCPSCKTGLANEDLEGNVCERCGTVVEKKPLRQFSIEITKYAEKLLDGLESLDWKENVKDLERNWIGKSEGAEIEFKIKSSNFEKPFTIFTTRPDTLFGCTYCVLSPEHALVSEMLASGQIENKEEVEKYIEEVKLKTEIERSAEGREKTGVELKGVKAVNPANNEEAPIFIADYVLASYGTGAIMAVPAHDERDFEFAKKYKLPVKQVIAPFFTYKDVEYAHKYDQPAEVLQGVYAALYNPKTDSYLCMDWKHALKHSVVTGTVEEGEDPLETAQREIIEETGYKNFALRNIAPLYTASDYYETRKEKNIKAVSQLFLFDLLNEERDQISEKELAKHEPVWIKKDELVDYLCYDKNLEHYAIIARHIFNQSEIPYSNLGLLVNSGKFDRLQSEEAKKAITEFVGGKMVIRYKLRDWVFARQRYWGEPFPLVHIHDGVGNKNIVPVDESDLPVVLPDVKDYEPTGTGESPLANIEEWVNVKGYVTEKGTFKVLSEGEDLGGAVEIVNAKRETNTMPQWAGSSWYWLRYMDPRNTERFVGRDVEKYWGQVDVYLGGLEHATRHLIYGRFWHRFLYDIGELSTPEPFKRLEGVGLVLGEGGVKMSKRLGNIINPDDVAEKWGVDTLRTYLLFMGPYHDAVAWNSQNLIGPRRFLERVWAAQYKLGEKQISPELDILLNQTIKKLTEDNEALRYNTGVSALMILFNAMEKEEVIDKALYLTFLKLLAPYAPFMTEELWQDLGGEGSIHSQVWPKFDESKLKDSTVNIAFQVCGKVRTIVTVANGASEQEVLEVVQATAEYKKWVGENTPKKVIFVPNKILNLIV